MNTNILEPDSSAVAESFEEALELSQTTFDQRIVSINPSDFRLNDDLTVDLHGSDAMDQLKFSKSGIESLCKATSPKIPFDPFAAHISQELFRENVHELMLKAESLRLAVRKNEPVIVGVMTGDMAGVSNSGVLNGAVRKLATEQESECRIMFTDQSMTAQLTQDVQIAPIVGDISKLGQVFFNSPVAEHVAYGRLFTMRCVCTNGAVMPKSVGHFRSTFDFGDDEEKAIGNMKRKLENLSMSRVKIATRYQAMAETRCNELLWSRAWSAVKRISEDADDADNILQTEKETRVEIRKYVKDAKDNPLDFEPREIMKNTVYEVFNHVTAGANDYLSDPRKAIRFQIFGGKFLDHVLKMPELN